MPEGALLEAGVGYMRRVLIGKVPEHVRSAASWVQVTYDGEGYWGPALPGSRRPILATRL